MQSIFTDTVHGYQADIQHATISKPDRFEIEAAKQDKDNSMRFTHHYQFDGLDEIALVIDFDYEPEEKEVLYPIDEAYPGCPENAVISSVQFNIGGVYSTVTGMIDEAIMEELVEACLEHYRGYE